MKKIVLLFIVVFAAALSQAQGSLEKNSEGEYRIKTDQDTVWKPVGITFASGSERYVEYFTVAIAEPNVPITVSRNEKTLEIRKIFKKLVAARYVYIKYQEADQKIIVFASQRQEETWQYYAIFALISIVCMILYNIFDIPELFAGVMIAGFVSICIAIALTLDFPSILTVVSVIANVLAIAAIFYSNGRVYGPYQCYANIYYAAMLAHVLCLYL